MRCVHCLANSKYGERAERNGHCPTCGRRFAFEPQQGDPLPDMAFKLALDAVSDLGRASWTTLHLYYEVCRRVRRRRLGERLLRRPLVSLSGLWITELLARWETSEHEVPPGRLARGAFGDEPPSADVAEELGAYSYEQIVVCDRDETADLLIANRFHADNACPVLSFAGHPRRAYELLLPVIRKRPPATVIVLHDADWEGCALADAILEDPRWFAGVEPPRVVDAGLRPRHARRFRGLYLPAETTGSGLPADEEKWLSRYQLDLEVITPRALLGVMGAVVRGEREPPADSERGGGWLRSNPDAWGDANEDDDVG